MKKSAKKIMFEINLQDLCEQAGVSFYDDELVSENGRKIYRVYITKKGGVSLDECAKVSEILSPILDVKPPCVGEYNLEVSSPGLERKLTKLRHFTMSLGEKISLTLDDKTKIIGEIVDVVGELIIVFDELNHTKKELPFSDIKKAKTFFKWD